MIKTRIFQFVGHIHNMQLCIEMISFINHENESTLRWFYSFCEPRNFSLCPRRLVGVYSGGIQISAIRWGEIWWKSIPEAGNFPRGLADLWPTKVIETKYMYVNIKYYALPFKGLESVRPMEPLFLLVHCHILILLFRCLCQCYHFDACRTESVRRSPIL